MAELTNSGVLFTTLAKDCIPTLAFDHRHDCTFVACTNDAIAFPMTHLASIFNMQCPIAQRPPVGDLPVSISPTRIALPLLLLEAQTLPKNSGLSLVSINILVKRLMADGQSCCNLLRTPLHAHQRTGFFPYPRLNGCGIANVLRTLCRELTRLFGSIAPRTSITESTPG